MYVCCSGLLYTWLQNSFMRFRRVTMATSPVFIVTTTQRVLILGLTRDTDLELRLLGKLTNRGRKHEINLIN